MNRQTYKIVKFVHYQLIQMVLFTKEKLVVIHSKIRYKKNNLLFTKLNKNKIP